MSARPGPRKGVASNLDPYSDLKMPGTGILSEIV